MGIEWRAYRLFIELDGAVHDAKHQAYDQYRYKWMTEQGFTGLRFTTDEVTNKVQRR